MATRSPGPSLGLRREGDVLLLPDVLFVRAAIVKLLYPLLATRFKQSNVSLNENKKSKFKVRLLSSKSYQCKLHFFYLL